jgi:hypothetical protein
MTKKNWRGPRPWARGLRPHLWVTGTDPVRHEQYHCWARARAQAHFRKESWLLPFEDWAQAWGDSWHLRGRGSEDLLLMRRDWLKPWQPDNIELVDRRQFSQRQHQIKAQRKAMKNEHRSKV